MSKLGARLPNEEILQFIERNLNISIAREAFASREYYNAHHPEGKNTPAFYANNGLGDGSHTVLVDLKGINYVVMTSTKAHKGPIEIFKSGRDPRKDIEKDNER